LVKKFFHYEEAVISIFRPAVVNSKDDHHTTTWDGHPIANSKSLYSFERILYLLKGQGVLELVSWCNMLAGQVTDQEWWESIAVCP
jgi:hypothetical protein